LPAEVKNGTITFEDIAAGVIPKLDVTGSAKAGQQGGISTATASPLPLSGKATFTPDVGDVSAIAAEGRFTIATANAGQFCSPAVFLLVNGEPTRVFVSPEDGEDSTTLVETVG